MSGRHHLMMRRLVVAVLVVHAWLLAGLSPSGAAAANASGTGLVNGMPCNNLCKAYMAWSDRMMAQFHPAQHRAPLRPATAAHPKNPEQPPRHAAPTRRPGLNAFARLQHQADPARAAPPPVEEAPPQVETAAAPPTDSVAELTAMADSVAEQRANTGNATTAAAEATPVSFVDPLAMTAEPVTTGQVASGSPRRLPVSLILALCAMLAFGCWWWIRGTQAAHAMQSYPGPADA